MPDLAAPPAVSSRHSVLFYNDQAELVSELVNYVDEALRDNGSAIVVATRDHRLALQAALGPRRAHAALGDGRLSVLDAAQTLALLMRDGHPDPDQFAYVVGGLLQHHRSAGGKLHVYGEMVALLWEEGNTEGALQLEHLWNQLLRTTPCRRLCAYPLHEALARQFDGLAQIAERHDSIYMSG
jgi:hypothetical protein